MIPDTTPNLTGKLVRKVGGSYEAQGLVVADFHTSSGERRVVFEFSSPPGMLHIFNLKQLELVSTPDESPRERVRAEYFRSQLDSGESLL